MSYLQRTATLAGIPRRAFATGRDLGKLPEAVLVDAVRIPFQLSGTGYKKQQAYQLLQYSLEGLLDRTKFPASKIDRVIGGTVIQEVKTSNIAREAALAAGIPNTVPANTVTLACISSNVAISNGIDLIRLGQADAIVACGVETMSDVPIRFSRNVRQRLIASQKVKGIAGYLGLLKGLKMKDLAPELPSVAEFSSGETMGFSADRLAAAFGVSRRDQDLFAVRSHQLAAKAASQGLLKDLIPVTLADGTTITADNIIRGDATIEKLSTLKPAFVKPQGTITAGNASALTDGSSAALVMSKERAIAHGYKPLAYLRDNIFVAQDPFDELLLGPAYGIAKLLDRNGLTINDIDVVELHEAFAGQVLANLVALRSESFNKEKLKRTSTFGDIPMEKINLWGGSLSLGHPFGATGVRLVATAANRLIHENKKLALIAACAAGGQAFACIVERY